MEALNLRYITFSDEGVSNYVIFETDKYDIELNDGKFQLLKNNLYMNDKEILHIYNDIVNILDQLTILLLQADSSQTQLNKIVTFNSQTVHNDMLKYCEDLKRIFESLFIRMKDNSVLYKNKLYKQYLKFNQPNEVISKFNMICDIIIDSFKTYAIQLVTYFISIIKNNLIENERDELMNDEIKTGFNRNENIIPIESSKKETEATFLYVSKNNKMMVSKLKNKRKKYLVNIKNNTCTCPDFLLRKMQQGLCCKHLIEIRNKSYCLLAIDRVMDSLSQSSYNNSYVPFKQMLHVVYDNSINYNS